MIAVALKGLAGRKIRALLTAFAVVIGVSMVSGTFILTDTMQKSFDGLFTASADEDRRRHQRQGGRQELHERQRRHDSRVAARQGPGAARGRGGRAARSPRRRPTSPTSSAATARRPRKESVGGSYRSPPTRASARSSSRPAPAARARRGRDRRRHRHQAALQGRRLRRRLDARQAARRTGSAARCRSAASTRSASRASPPGTSRPPRRCSTARAASTASRSPRSRAPRPRSSCRPIKPLLPADLQVKDSAKQAKDDAAELDSSMAMIRDVPARLRRHRAARRRVRDLQHAVDHGRPAHARVRHAADARRLAQAGHALGRARGPRDRPARLGDRARVRARDRQGHGRPVRRAGRRAAQGRDGDRRRTRSSSR